MLQKNDLLYIMQNPAKVMKEFDLLRSALDGDIQLSISPATVNRVATSEAWTRSVVIKLVNSKGDIHDWFNGDLSVAIADTSTAGTASIADTTPPMVNGVCVVTISGNAVAWAGGETNTLTVNSLTVLGNTITGGTSVETITA